MHTLSQLWLTSYNFAAGMTAIYLLANDHSQSTVFQFLELSVFVELMHHFVGIQQIKRHLLINMLLNAFVLEYVLCFQPEPALVTAWVVLRCVSKAVRHFYNAYLSLDLKFEYFLIDYSRMTSFYVLYVAEYALTVLLLWQAIPGVKQSAAMKINMPNALNLDLDLTLVYFCVLTLSVPNFVNTFVYLHKKRQQQLYSIYSE